jgi:hypothetical protein
VLAFAPGLVGANLQGANLWGANLQEANLYRVGLHEADLHGAVHLTQEQLERTIGDAVTKIPEGLTKPTAWLGSSSDQAYVAL